VAEWEQAVQSQEDELREMGMELTQRAREWQRTQRSSSLHSFEAYLTALQKFNSNSDAAFCEIEPGAMDAMGLELLANLAVAIVDPDRAVPPVTPLGGFSGREAGGPGKAAKEALCYLVDWFYQDDVLKESWQHQGYSALGCDPRTDEWQGAVDEYIQIATALVRACEDAGSATVQTAGSPTLAPPHPPGKSECQAALDLLDAVRLCVLHQAAIPGDSSGARLEPPNGPGLLHLAARRGLAAAAELLLIAGGQVDLRDHEGRTALHMCFCVGTVDRGAMKKMLIEWGADPNAADSKGRTPMHYAILGTTIIGEPRERLPDDDGDWPHGEAPVPGELDEYLLQSGRIDLNAEDSEGYTPLWQTVKRCGDRGMGGDHVQHAHRQLAALLEHGQRGEGVAGALEVDCLRHGRSGQAPEAGSPGEFQRTPLFAAVQNKDVAAVSALLEAKADGAYLDTKGDSPLSLAIREASSEVDIELTEVLLAAPLPASATWREPSFPATKDGERSLAHLLVDSVHRGGEVTRRLLEALAARAGGGEALDVLDQRGRSVLERAVREECLPLLGCLLGLGAVVGGGQGGINPNVFCGSSTEPLLHLACGLSYPTAELLATHQRTQIDIRAGDAGRHTALQEWVATRGGQEAGSSSAKVMKLLIANKADPDACYADPARGIGLGLQPGETTMLHYACATKDAASIDILLAAGAQTSRVPGRPLLQVAVEIESKTERDVAVIQPLLQHRDPTEEELAPSLRSAVRMAMDACSEQHRALRVCIVDIVLRFAPGPATPAVLAMELASERESQTGQTLLGLLLSDLSRFPGSLDPALEAAVAHGQLWATESLLETSLVASRATDPNAGRIHVAYTQGRFDLLQALLIARASVDAVDEADDTILDRICDQRVGAEGTTSANQGLWMMRLCLEKGAADPNHVASTTGEGLLHRACRQGRWALTELLIKHGASLVATDPDTGRTPLHHATAALSTKCLKACLAAIASQELSGAIDLQDAQGDTPMHIAAREGEQRLLLLLHEAGGDPEIRNKERETPKALLRLVLDDLERAASDAVAASERRWEDSVVGQWRASDVVAWIWSLEFGREGGAMVARRFAEAGIDGQDLLSLQDGDLLPCWQGGIGIELSVHRRKILRAVDAMCRDDDEAVRALDHALAEAVARHCTPEEHAWIAAAVGRHYGASDRHHQQVGSGSSPRALGGA